MLGDPVLEEGEYLFGIVALARDQAAQVGQGLEGESAEVEGHRMGEPVSTVREDRLGELLVEFKHVLAHGPHPSKWSRSIVGSNGDEPEWRRVPNWPRTTLAQWQWRALVISDPKVRSPTRPPSTLENVEGIACGSIPEVLVGVSNGSLDLGLVPLENAIEGTVSATIDGLVFDNDLVIEREIVLPIHLHLLAKRGVSPS